MAGGTTGGYVDKGGNLTAVASDTQQSPAASGPTANSCKWIALGHDPMVPGKDSTVVVYNSDGLQVLSPTGRWLQKICDGNPVAFNGVYAVPAPAQTPGSSEAAARQARESVAIPPPVPSTAPPADRRLYVQMPTWLALDPAWWKPYQATASVGTVSATVTATPVRAVWAMGDGNQVVCAGPGVIWHKGLPESATNCSHTYTHSSSGQPGGRYTIGVTVEFAVSWSSSTGAGGTLPTLTRTASLSVEVGEIQAVITGP